MGKKKIFNNFLYGNKGVWIIWPIWQRLCFSKLKVNYIVSFMCVMVFISCLNDHPADAEILSQRLVMFVTWSSSSDVCDVIRLRHDPEVKAPHLAQFQLWCHRKCSCVYFPRPSGGFPGRWWNKLGFGSVWCYPSPQRKLKIFGYNTLICDLLDSNDSTAPLIPTWGSANEFRGRRLRPQLLQDQSEGGASEKVG